MTPKQLGRAFEAARLKATDEYKRDVTLAWNVVRIYFTAKGKKRLMPLQDLLGEVKTQTSDRQSPAQMRSVLALVGELHGIRMRRADG